MRTTYLNLLMRPHCYTSFPSHAHFIPRKFPMPKLQQRSIGISHSSSSGFRGTRYGSGGHQLFTGVAISAVGLGLACFSWPRVHCDTTPKLSTNLVKAQPVADDDALPPLPPSSVSFYELGFGTVAGICAGVFVKKGVKAAAWLLGGIFVLLQYLNSASVIRVDWPQISSRFENLFHTTDASGSKKPPTVRSLWNWLVDFLTADFQPRASFIAGFAFGLRMG